MMELDLLTAVSPIDGRYRSKAGTLAAYFSEYALMKYRVRVEIEYFITLCELPLPQLASFDMTRFESLRVWLCRAENRRFVFYGYGQRALEQRRRKTNKG